MKDRNRITKVSIEGFRSLKSVQGLELRDLNVLIGPNGSGKSNLIGFFQMLGFALTGSIQLFISKRGGGDSLLFRGSKETPVLRGNLEFKSNKGRNGYEFKMAHAAEDALIYTHETITFHPDDRSQPFRQELEVGGKESAIIKAAQGGEDDPKTRAAKFIRNILKNKRVYQFHDTSLSSFIRKTTDISKSRYLSDDGGSLAAMLYSLKSYQEPYYRRIVETVRREIPGFKNFVLEPEPHNPDKIMLRWRGDDPRYEFGPHQTSDGSLRFMALATLLLQPEDTLPDMIIIDEPELGLHPAAEEVVGALIRSASKNCQVLVATQSATLLDAFAPEDVLVAEMKDGETSIKRQSAENLKVWLEDYTLGEVWCKNLMGGRP